MDSKQFEYNEPIFSVLVAGDVDLSEYDINKKVEPYVVYKFNDRGKIRQQAIDIYKEFLKNNDDATSLMSSFLNVKLQEIEESTDEEYFEIATKGMTFDKVTGDALSTINPNGKYRYITEPNENTAVPLLGNKFQCNVSELPTYKIDEYLKSKYEEHWDYVMKDCAKMTKDNLIQTYGDKNTYVSVMMEPMFYNAFVSSETGWVEPNYNEQNEWVLTFRDKFIKKLSKNTKLKVYNFIR